MTEITSTANSNPTSPTPSSPSSFHSNQDDLLPSADPSTEDVDFKELDLNDQDKQQEDPAEEQLGGEKLGEGEREGEGEGLEESEHDNQNRTTSSKPGHSLASEMDQAMKGDSMEGEEAKDNGNQEELPAKPEGDSGVKELEPSTASPPIDSAADQTEENYTIDSSTTSEETQEKPQEEPKEETGIASTSNLISPSQDSAATAPLPAPAAVESPKSTSDSKSNSKAGGVAELMKRFQSQSTSNSKSTSPSSSPSIFNSSPINTSNSTFKSQNQSPKTSIEASRDVKTKEEIPIESKIEESKSPDSFAPISPPQDHQDVLSSTSPWADQVSKSSSSASVNSTSTTMNQEEPNRFSTLSNSDPTRHSQVGDTAGKPEVTSINRGSTRFSTVSLSSSNNNAESNPSNGKRNTITDNNRHSRQPSGQDQNYDFLLARLENENGRLSRDPKANRASIDGKDRLKDEFNRLKSEKEKSGRHSRENSREGGSNLRTEVLASPSNSEIKEETVTEELEDDSIDWDFWGSVMNNYQLVAQTRPSELSLAIQAGIPAALRGMMWQLMSSSKDEEMEIIYAYYLKQTTSHEKSIRRDLSRTFPEQDYFKEGKGIGQENLFNVIKAYSLFDEEVGYCQGMQFIVGPLLLNMPDEEAFSTFVRLMKSYDLRGHFTPNMPSLQLRLFQFDCLLEEILPLLYKHLVRLGITSSTYASQWFMTCE